MKFIEDYLKKLLKNYFEKWIEHCQSLIQFFTKNGFWKIKSFTEKNYRTHRQE